MERKSLNQLPQDMIRKVFNYGKERNINRELNEIYNLSEYDKY